jgi:hypothetical protein
MWPPTFGDPDAKSKNRLDNAHGYRPRHAANTSHNDGPSQLYNVAGWANTHLAGMP